ncbi:Cell division protein FtsW [Sporanaerobacter sp. PP17-6a]|nr:Cell division protein FtsW [Sporanaerobacter sp. PP17-6a]
MKKMFDKLVSYKVPRNFLVLFDLMALLLLFIYEKENLDAFTMISAISMVFIIYISNFILIKISTGDNYIFLIATMLISIGTVMIYRINPEIGIRQVIWVSMGVFAFFLSYIMTKKIKRLNKRMKLYLGISLGLFIITLVFGRNINGATNWIKVGGFNFQPSEVIKLLFIFFLASYYSNIEKYKKNYRNGYYVILVVYIFIGFLFMQRDLGMAALFYLIFLGIQYVYEDNRKLILYNVLFSLVGIVLGYTLFDHVRIRIATWLDPWKYIDNKGYQITQSLFAIASGGFFGTGIGLGHPDFIPAVHTDFIFSAICEEMGVFTGMAIIMLFLILVYRGFKIAFSQDDKFFQIVAFGISILFGFQSFIIFGGVMKLIPLTGITLPFVSYGGSSLLSSFIALGVLQVASEEIEQEEVEDEKRA